MQIGELLTSSDLSELIAGILLFYIIPYIVLIFIIDFLYYSLRRDKGFCIYSPAISFAILIIFHIMWAVMTCKLIRDYYMRMQITIIILPLCWIFTEIIRYKKFNESLLLQL